MVTHDLLVYHELCLSYLDTRSCQPFSMSQPASTIMPKLLFASQCTETLRIAHSLDISCFYFCSVIKGLKTVFAQARFAFGSFLDFLCQVSCLSCTLSFISTQQMVQASLHEPSIAKASVCKQMHRSIHKSSFSSKPDPLHISFLYFCFDVKGLRFFRSAFAQKVVFGRLLDSFLHGYLCLSCMLSFFM